MPKLIYRVVSTCGALGYGYPRESLRAALHGRVDAIVCDGGSVDAGPFYLGAGKAYFERGAIKADYHHMVEVGRAFGCPVIVGSSGTAGGNRNLDGMIDIAKDVFDELGLCEAKVAVIRSEIDPELAIRELRNGELRPTGCGPALSEEALRGSIIVGQMGVHPLIAALVGGAQYIFAGRACDSALFAADMIRHGVDAGLAYHAGHILESGALACEPGSPADCLVCEIYDDRTAVFKAPNVARRCTPHSLAAHSLYQQSHPHLQFYPEGILSTEQTQFFSHDNRSAGIRNSRFIRAGRPWPWSIKLEAALWLGSRKVSLIFIRPDDLPHISPDLQVYGRNGVRSSPVRGTARELGIVIETAARTVDAATRLAQVIAERFVHYGGLDRHATMAHLACPLSPQHVSMTGKDGMHGALLLAGTRDAAFINRYAAIKAAVVASALKDLASIAPGAAFTISEADASNPALLLRTVDRDPEQLLTRHQQEIDDIARMAHVTADSKLNLDAADAYEWSLYHLLQNEDVIRNKIFPVTHYRANKAHWIELRAERPRYFDIGENGYHGDLDERTLSFIVDHPPVGEPIGWRRLRDMAAVVRSKDAGVNRITFDILFASGENYEAALYSNAFGKDNIAHALGVSPERVVGAFFVDTCNAIKISVDRPNVSASPDDRDVFGTQQQADIEDMRIPIYAAALAQASSF